MTRLDSSTNDELEATVRDALDVYAREAARTIDGDWNALDEGIRQRRSRRVVRRGLLAASMAALAASVLFVAVGRGGDALLVEVDAAEAPVANDDLSVAPVVGGASTPSGGGYWLVRSDGAIDAFGDAKFFGAPAEAGTDESIVGMAAVPDGGGYWVVGANGGLLAFGDAGFLGRPADIAPDDPVVGISATPDGGGYWVVTSGGSVYAYGSAQFFGSTGAVALDDPIVGIVPTPEADGYWLLGRDRGLFAFGDAQFFGSAMDDGPDDPAVALIADPDGLGYSIVTARGLIHGFGSVGGETGFVLGPVAAAFGGPGGAVVTVAPDGTLL